MKKYKNTIEFEVYGNYALFADPVTRVGGEQCMYKVLLVDDEPIIVEGLSRSIPWERWNCRVVATANDGTEGKNLIEKERPYTCIVLPFSLYTKIDDPKGLADSDSWALAC